MTTGEEKCEQESSDEEDSDSSGSNSVPFGDGDGKCIKAASKVRRELKILEFLIHTFAHTPSLFKIHHNQVETPDFGHRMLVFAVNIRHRHPSGSVQGPSQRCNECTVIRSCIKRPFLQKDFSRRVVIMYSTYSCSIFQAPNYRQTSAVMMTHLMCQIWTSLRKHTRIFVTSQLGWTHVPSGVLAQLIQTMMSLGLTCPGVCRPSTLWPMSPSRGRLRG